MGRFLLARRRSRWPALLLTFALLIYLRSRITAGQPEKLHAIARERFKAEPTSLVAHHLADLVRRHALGDALRHHGVRAVHAAAGIVVLAAIGANIYWVSSGR